VLLEPSDHVRDDPKRRAGAGRGRGRRYGIRIARAVRLKRLDRLIEQLPKAFIPNHGRKIQDYLNNRY